MEIICENCGECLSISKRSGEDTIYSACFYRTPFKERSSIDNIPGLHSLPVPDACEGFCPKKDLNVIIEEILEKYGK